MRVGVVGDLLSSRSVAVHQTDHEVIRSIFGGNEGELRCLRIDAEGGVAGSNGGLLGVALVACGGSVRPLALRSGSGRLHAEGVNAVVVHVGRKIRGRGGAAVDDDHVAVIAAVAEKLDAVGLRAGDLRPHRGGGAVHPGDRGGLCEIHGNFHGLNVAPVPGGVHDHKIHVRCFRAETGEIDLRFAGGDVLHVCRGKKSILRRLLAADDVVDLAGLVGGEGHGAVGSVRAARALAGDGGRGLIDGESAARFRPRAQNIAVDGLHLEGVGAGLFQREGVAGRIRGDGRRDLRAVLIELHAVGRSAGDFRPHRGGGAVHPGERGGGREIERHGHGLHFAAVSETVLGGVADDDGGTVGKAGERERVVLALRERHGAAGGEYIGGIVVENIVKLAVLAGDEGNGGGVLRRALDAVGRHREDGGGGVAHRFGAALRPRADGVRADGTHGERVNAVVLHHVGEIIRSGRTIHGDGIAVGVGAQIELHGVIIHTLHAGPRGLLAVPDGSGRRGEHRGDRCGQKLGRMAEGVLRGNVDGVGVGVEILERDRIRAADELGLRLVLHDVRRGSGFAVELVVVCTGFRGSEGDAALGLRGAHGGGNSQRGGFAVVKNKLLHFGGGSGGELLLRGSRAADVERGAVEHLAERERVVLIGGNGADAALDRAGGDLDLAGSAGQVDAVFRLDLAERIHADLHAGSTDNGLHAGSAAGDADLARNGHGGVLCDDDAGGVIRHLDRAGALERQTAALHMENGSVGIALAVGELERDRLTGQLERHVLVERKRRGEDDILDGFIDNIGSSRGNARKVRDDLGVVCHRRHGQQRYCHQHGEQKSHQFLCHNKVPP